MKYQWFLVHQVLSRPVQREWYWTTKFRLLHMQQIRDHRLFRRLLRIVSDKRPIYHRGYWLGVGSRCRIYSITGLALTMAGAQSSHNKLPCDLNGLSIEFLRSGGRQRHLPWWTTAPHTCAYVCVSCV